MLTKRTLYLVMILFLFTIAYVYAEPVTLQQEAVKDKVSPGDTAEFLLKVRNNRDVADNFMVGINELDVYPFSNIIESSELSQEVLKLKPGESITVNLKLKVFDDATPNVNYKTYARVRSLINSDVSDKEELIISVLAPVNLAEIKTTFPDELVAAKNHVFNITLKNKVNKILKDVEISIVSELFQQSFKTDLYYGLPITKEIKYDLDPSTKPGEYKLEVKLFYNKRLRGSLIKEFEVVRNPNVLEKSEVESGFLVDVYRFEKENKGNLIMQENVFLPLGGVARLFTEVNVPAEKIESGYKWNFELKPGENYVIVAKTDYRILFYGTIIIIMFLLGMWYHLHKTVVIKKELYHAKDEKTGTSYVKIILRVKNKGSPLRNVKIVDIVPSILKVTGEYGTLKPSQIQSTFGGNRLIWEVSHLDLGDERILSYKLEAKHDLMVPTTLPPAAVIYKKFNNRLTKVSNKVVFVPKKDKSHRA